MRDGKTRKIERASGNDGGMIAFLDTYAVKLVVVTGGEAGAEFPVTAERVTLGRGPGVDVAFDDPAMSRQHAAIDFVEDGFRIQDLGSTNGVLIDGKPAQVATLIHGSRFEIGDRQFQLVIEQRADAPDVYELPSV